MHDVHKLPRRMPWCSVLNLSKSPLIVPFPYTPVFPLPTSHTPSFIPSSLFNFIFLYSSVNPPFVLAVHLPSLPHPLVSNCMYIICDSQLLLVVSPAESCHAHQLPCWFDHKDHYHHTSTQNPVMCPAAFHQINWNHEDETGSPKTVRDLNVKINCVNFVSKGRCGSS